MVTNLMKENSMVTTDSDPWTDIEPPELDEKINANRVDSKLQWNLFWARDINRSCLLVFGFACDSAPSQRLPRPRGLELELAKPDQNSRQTLVLRLTDAQNRDIFHRLCLDIVDATRLADSEAAAVAIFLARTWRWHHLLRGGGSDNLSDEEQKGLIGELHVIERFLLDRLSPSEIVTSWLGPLGGPKDFEIGGVAIECKARRGASQPYIRISSENQLDISSVSDLLLHVIDLNAAAEQTPFAFTVSDIAKRIHENFRASDMQAADEFEGLLRSAGFDWAHDYSKSRWILGSSRCFEVADAFPKISASGLPAGVSNVTYKLALEDYNDFRIEEDAVEQKLMEVTDGVDD